MDGRAIRRLRGSLMMTQKQFGLLIHAHGATVCRWENGQKAPGPWHKDLLETIQKGQRRLPDVAELALKFMEANAPVDALGALLIAALVARN